MRTFRFHPSARAELFDAIRYYNSQQRGLGLRFQEYADDALTHIREFPETGFLSPRETRTLSIKTFPYGIVFKEISDQFWIIAIRDYRRREDYWHHRVDELDD